MKTFLFFVFLLLLVPMSVLNPMGRPAFLGYYTGVIATLIAMRLAARAIEGHSRRPLSN